MAITIERRTITVQTHQRPPAVSCAGKVRFDSAALAHAIAKRRGKARKVNHDDARRRREAYRCKHCGGWHLGGR